MREYLKIVHKIRRYGIKKPNRTGIDTYSIFAPQFRHWMPDGFPLLTTKKMPFKAVLTELLWFLRAEQNTDFLHEHGVHIWDQWAEDGNVGPIYGNQWRRWPAAEQSSANLFALEGTYCIDQLQDVITRLRRDPFDRRLIVSAWNPSDIPRMVLPPCHVMFQLVYDGRLNLHMYQRSADWAIGVPFNIASYGLLLYMIAHVTDHVPGELVISYGDAHIYENHMSVIDEQLLRPTRELPQLFLDSDVHEIDEFTHDSFFLSSYDPHPKLDFGEVAV